MKHYSVICSLLIVYLFNSSCKEKEVASNPVKDTPQTATTRESTSSQKADTDELRRIFMRGISSKKTSSEPNINSWNERNDALRKLSIADLHSLILSLDETSEVDRSIRTVALLQLADRDVKMALNAAAELPPNTSAVVLMGFYSKAVANNPKEATDWILERGMKDKSSPLISRRLALELSVKAPEEAYALFAQMEPKMRLWMGELLVGRLAESDPQRAFLAVSKIPESERARLYAAVAAGASVKDGALAFKMMTETGSKEVAALACPNLFVSWIEHDPAAAGAALATLDASNIQQVFKNPDNLSRLVARNPELALQSLDKLVFSKATADMFTKAAREIALKDPAAAMSWLADFPEGPGKGKLLQVAGTAQTEKNPAASVPAFLATTGNSSYRKELVTAAATSWGRVNVEEALRYSDNLPPAEQGLYSATVLQTAVNRNIDTAIELITANKLSQQVIKSPEYSEVVKAAGRTYATANMQKAVAWAESLNGPGAAAAVQGVTAAWAAEDIAAAGKWVGELPASPSRNAAIEELAGQLDSTDPEAAKQWRSQIR